MFTGIITESGMIRSRSRSGISIRASRTLVHKLNLGVSIAVDGACLTVVKKDKNTFSAGIMPETARKTTLSAFRRGVHVNLELPATPATFFSGHIVQGHVDGVGIVQDIRKDGSGRLLKIVIPSTLARYVVPKGSVALNGISLTVVGSGRDHFTVGIIPHTLKVTNLCTLQRGDAVNIEVDVLAKYVEKFV
jgi:riboflavin synthase